MMITPLSINFDFNEVFEYYQTLEQKYQHLKWTTALLDSVNDSEKHQLTGVFGWAIQSNLEDLTVPCPPYDVHKTGAKIYRDTELMFGFAKKIKDFFGPVRQLGIAGHPPGVVIRQHIDNPEYFKIHIPITSNHRSYFSFGDINYVMEPGRMYIVDTNIMHGTSNEGNSTRVHMMFKLPMSIRDNIQKISGAL